MVTSTVMNEAIRKLDVSFPKWEDFPQLYVS